VGRTPAEARQDALRTALGRALAAQVDAGTWAGCGRDLAEGLCRDSRGLILRCQEVGAGKEWRLRGTLHHEDVAVDVSRQALWERLRAAGVPCRGDRPGS
jgi:hypothetical protein